jgi:hypothetical protein
VSSKSNTILLSIRFGPFRLPQDIQNPDREFERIRIGELCNRDLNTAQTLHFLLVFPGNFHEINWGKMLTFVDLGIALKVEQNLFLTVHVKDFQAAMIWFWMTAILFHSSSKCRLFRFRAVSETNNHFAIREFEGAVQ